ncbi:MAG: hypothetical protein RBT49_04940 [Bacteroidales bacterium]|nr:hypothetical protein [Bacteroidales bacterium]
MKKYILLLAILFIISCEPEKESRANLYIKNDSSHNIELTVFNAWLPNQNSQDTTFVLEPNSEISYFFIVDGELSNYNLLPFGGTADSVHLDFNDNLRIIYRRDDLNPRNIIDINSWIGGKVDDYLYEYEYFITDEDYENAIEIK